MAQTIDMTGKAALVTGAGSGLGKATALRLAEAAQRLREFGPNALATHRVRAAAVLLRQVRNPILILLLAALRRRPAGAPDRPGRFRGAIPARVL